MRIFICNTNLLVVPKKGHAYLMTLENKFIRCVGKEEAQKLVTKVSAKEIAFVISPQLPMIPLWHHIPLLSGRSADMRIEGEYYHDDDSKKTWFGLTRIEIDFFVRSNDHHIEFLAFSLNPKPSTMYGTSGTRTQKIITVKAIGVAKELTVNTCCFPDENPNYEFVLDTRNCFEYTRSTDIATYFHSKGELIKSLEQAFERSLTKEEEASLENDHNSPGFKEGSWYYRPDIWKS